MILRISFCLFFCLFGLLVQGQEADIRFTIRNAGINVNGSFDDTALQHHFNVQNLNESSFKLEIQTTSINTGISGRDKHLRKAKYFDVEKYPKLTFESSGISKTNSGYLLIGLLTIKETSKTIEIPFTIEKDQESGKQFLKGYVELDRREYGVGKNHLIMGDLVKVYIEVPYTPAQ